MAAGYAPRYSEQPLEGEALARVRSSLQKLLDAHDPFPGVVIDRNWNVLPGNKASVRMCTGIPPRSTWAGPTTTDVRDPVIPWHFSLNGEELFLFTTLSTFGTPNGVTLSELAIELFFPADAATEAVLRRLVL